MTSNGPVERERVRVGLDEREVRMRARARAIISAEKSTPDALGRLERREEVAAGAADLEDALPGRDLHPVEPREPRVVVAAPAAVQRRSAGERVPVRDAAPPVLVLRAVA